MKINIIKYSLFLLLSLSLFEAKAQTSENNTLYFMENVAARQVLNTAFQPKSNVVVSLPVLGFTHFGASNSSVTLKDIVYNKNNKSIFFFHPEGDKDKFYNTLRNNTRVAQSFRANLLTVGFRANNTAYWTISSSARVESNAVFPKSLMELALYGTREEKNNKFNFSSLDIESMAFTDVSLGYSKQINEKLTVGATGSFLIGHGHAVLDNSNLTLEGGAEKWTVKGQGKFHSAAPGLEIGDKFSSYEFDTNELLANPINGFGAALSLGAVYKPIENLTISASLNDLGTICWSAKNVKNMSYKIDFETEGLDLSKENATDEFWEDVKRNMETKEDSNPYFSSLSPKLNIGGEYAFFDNVLSVGLLSKTQLYKSKIYEDITISANTRATNWLDFSLSYSLLNGRASNLGAGFSVRAGFAQLYVAADYVPMSYAKYKDKNNTNAILLPYNTKGVNVSMGLNLVFGNAKDADRDGVSDKKDLCPDTPRGVAVDKNGCPLDTDGDGVPDYLDKCPDTPEAAKGMVDADGCPLDSDGDGVPDYLDKCPGTPEAAKGKVDENGCPIDTDGDGVPDYLDKCPDTPKEVKGMVDANGCTLDSDGDGVPDYLDKCPNTPAKAKNLVDKNGCPIDTDGDGVPDYLDACPEVKGIKENNGCPEIKKEVKLLFQKALQGIQFETGKSTIRKSSHTILNQIAKVLHDNPEYTVEIQGHTDNTGNEKRNLELSTQRAESVRKYLHKKGISENRMTSKGYGITKPVADNKTAAGRAKNRRVEFVISFEKTIIK